MTPTWKRCTSYPLELGPKDVHVVGVDYYVLATSLSLKWVLDINDPPNSQGEPHLNYSFTSSTSFSISASLDWGPLSAPNLSHYAPSSVYPFLSSTHSVLSPSHVSALLNTYSFDFTSHSLTYKPVAKKVWLVLAPLEEEYCMLRWLPDDPLAGLISLLTNPPDKDPHRNALMHLTLTQPNGCGLKGSS